jgi:alpha-L-rhamnosidase-like protein
MPGGWIGKGVRRLGDGLWDTDQYGGWVDPKSPLDAPSETTTTKHLVADAFLVCVTQVLADVSRAFGHGCQTAHYDAEQEQLRQLFDDTWTVNGSLANLLGHALRGTKSTVYFYALLLQTTVPRGHHARRHDLRQRLRPVRAR